MVDERRTVVVTTNLSIGKRSDGKMFAAHLDGLGLTAYGYTAEEAREGVTQLYGQWVNWHRDAGILEKRLNEYGVPWQWLDEYDGDIPVEQIHERTNASPVDAQPQHHAIHGEFALAA